jgi:4-amino-4-deoxy-L-arabinose transferase-like glycosyltransferase
VATAAETGRVAQWYRIGSWVQSRPLRIFIWSRLGIWAAAVYAWMWFLPRAVNPPNSHDLGYATQVWSRWDSGWFVAIAQHGYHAGDGSAAFYPLYPLLVGGIGRLFGGYYVSAGLVISLACCAGSFVLLYRIARRRLGDDPAALAVLYLAIFPMALFLQAVYNESLFLLLVLASFAFAERNSWLAAAAFAGLAILTRPTGFALLPPLVLLAWRSTQRRRALASLGLAPALFVLYPVWLSWKAHDAFAFVHAEAAWHRHLSHAGPFGGLWQGLRSGWDGLEQVVTGSTTHVYWPGGIGSDALHGAMLNLEDLAFTLVFLVLAVVAWRRLGAAYGLYAILALALPLSAPSSRWPLESMPRFCVVAFPAFLALASLTNSAAQRRFVVATSALFLGLAVFEWSTQQWVS